MSTALVARAAVRLTPAVVDAIVQRVEAGVPFTTAAVAAGVSLRTAEYWLEIANGKRTHWPDGTPVSEAVSGFLAPIAERIAVAQAQFEAEAVQSIAEAGDMVGKSGIREWRAKAWLLNNHPGTRKQYHEHRELKVEHSGQVNHEHRIAAAMSEPELLEALPAEWREMVPATETATDGDSEHEPHI